MKKQKRVFTCWTANEDIDKLFYGHGYINSDDAAVGIFMYSGLSTKKSTLKSKKFKITVELLNE